jgi:hypothetical protein
VYFDYQEQERTTMPSKIRIIKSGADGNANGVSANEIEKTVQQCEREMASAVKGWVAEWEARDRALKTAAASLVRSLENSTRSRAPQFGFNQ